MCAATPGLPSPGSRSATLRSKDHFLIQPFLLLLLLHLLIPAAATAGAAARREVNAVKSYIMSRDKTRSCHTVKRHTVDLVFSSSPGIVVSFDLWLVLAAFGQINVDRSCRVIWSIVWVVCPAWSSGVDKACWSQCFDGLFVYSLLGCFEMLSSGRSIFLCSS
jgi:hypothetical protein